MPDSSIDFVPIDYLTKISLRAGVPRCAPAVSTGAGLGGQRTGMVQLESNRYMHTRTRTHFWANNGSTNGSVVAEKDLYVEDSLCLPSLT